MVESSAKEVERRRYAWCIIIRSRRNQKLVAFQEEIVREVGKEKWK